MVWPHCGRQRLKITKFETVNIKYSILFRNNASQWSVSNGSDVRKGFWAMAFRALYKTTAKYFVTVCADSSLNIEKNGSGSKQTCYHS